MRKKTRNTLIIIIIIILGIVLIKNANIFAVGNYETLYKINWGHICCDQNFDYDIIYTRYIDDVSTFKCDDYTNECLIRIEYKGTSSIACPFGGACGKYDVCNLDGSSCISGYYDLQRAGAYKEFTLSVGKLIKFYPTNIGTTGEDKTTCTKKAKSFYIMGEENGKVFTQQSCVLSTELKGRVLKGGLNELSRTGANRCQNYMIDWIEVVTKTYTYNGQKVICQARELFKVDTNTFIDGSAKQAQGDRIPATIDCCPQEANCDPTTFKWKEVIKECIYNTECPNGGDPVAVSGTSYIKYYCQNNKCVQTEPISTECTTTAQCIQTKGTGYVCDLSPNNWGRCIKSILPSYCGDTHCDAINGETSISCPNDCGGGIKGKCKDCFSWLFSKFKTENKCSSQTVVEKHWYNPTTWILPGSVTQDATCPIYLVIVFGIAIVFIVIISKIAKRR